MTWLGAGESRSYHTVFRVLDGAAAVRAAVDAIQARQPQPAADVPVKV
jgi:hypothetical protein